MYVREDGAELVDGASDPIMGRLGFAPAAMSAMPFDEDDTADRPVVTTLRRIGRVAALGVRIGQRHVQERRAGDPAAWMFAPRRLFGGRAAVDACQGRAAFTRAIALQAVGETDGSPEDYDDLDWDTGLDDADEVSDAKPGERVGPILFTSTIWDPSGGSKVIVFHAAVVASRGEYEELLEERLGPRLAGSATVRVGYDASCPVSLGMVSNAIDDMLVRIAADPASPLATGLEIQLEQRFAS